MTAPLNSALRLASTAIPVRERSGALEILMVERNKDLSFGGMWAFPGGAIEAGDGQIPEIENEDMNWGCLLYTSPSPRDQRGSRMPSSA